MQVAVLGEGLVAPRAVHRNSQQLSAMFAELGNDFIVKRHLVAADRAPVRRIESKDDLPSLQIAEREPLIGRDPQLEIGSGCAGGQNLGHSIRFLLPCIAFGTAQAKSTGTAQTKSIVPYLAPSSGALTAINLLSFLRNPGPTAWPSCQRLSNLGRKSAESSTGYVIIRYAKLPNFHRACCRQSC